jgi:hypothetical protein
LLSVKNFFLIVIVLISFAFTIKSNAQLVFDYQTIISDVQLVTVKEKYQAVLGQHPLVFEQKKGGTGKIIPRNTENRTGIFLISLVLLFVFAGIKNAFFRHFSNLFKVFTTTNISKRQVKEQLENNSRASTFFLILYFFSISFILYLLFSSESLFYSKYTPISKYGICLSATIFFYFFKNGLAKMLAWIFNKEANYHEYQFTNSMINEFTGLFLFPLSVFLLIFNGNLLSVILAISILLLVAMNFFKYIRLVGLMKKMLSMNFVHFFLYLCAFEIMPLLVLIKLAR